MNANKTMLIILRSALALLVATLIFVFWKKCKMSALKKAIITAVGIILLIAATDPVCYRPKQPQEGIL